MERTGDTFDNWQIIPLKTLWYDPIRRYERGPQATPAEEEGEQGYTTKDKDTFNDVCEALEIDRAEQRVYFDWLKNSHRMGNDKRTCTKLFFPNPIGKVKKITKFDAGVHFPAPTGEDWESHRRQYEIRHGSIQPTANSVLRNFCRNTFNVFGLSQRETDF
eukprot:COSAG02_NODE_3136_length_7300_cov_4.065269_2_plen_161_part_00